MSAACGNSDLDIRSISERMTELITKAFDKLFPYVSAAAPKVEKEDQYKKYFDIIKKWDSEDDSKSNNDKNNTKSLSGG